MNCKHALNNLFLASYVVLGILCEGFFLSHKHVCNNPFMAMISMGSELVSISRRVNGIWHLFIDLEKLPKKMFVDIFKLFLSGLGHV